MRKKRPKEVGLKISRTRKRIMKERGWLISKKAREKLSLAHIDKKHSKKTKKKISNTLKKHFSIYNGNKHPLWKGGKWSYCHKLARRIMENYLKRKLRKGETIHHKDKNIKNNHIKNLHLFKSSGEHIKYHKSARGSFK